MVFSLIVVVKSALLQESVQHGESSSRYFLPLPANQSLSMKSSGKGCSSCIWSIMFHGRECWTLINTDFKELDIMSMPWSASVMVSDRISTDGLLTELGLKSLEIVMQIDPVWWYGHVCCFNGSTNKCTDYEVLEDKNIVNVKRPGSNELTVTIQRPCNWLKCLERGTKSKKPNPQKMYNMRSIWINK